MIKKFLKIFGFFDLEETNKNFDRLIDHILWAKIENGVVFNKDLSMQTTFSYRLPDFDNVAKEDLVNFFSNIDKILKILSSGWVLYSEAQRIKNGDDFENFYYLTLQYLLPIDTESRVKELFIKGNEKEAQTILENYSIFFKKETSKIFELFKDALKRENVCSLSSDETVTYLYSTVSPKRKALKAPENGMYVDCYLCDSVDFKNSEPMLDGHHICVISFLDYPGSLMPEVLNRLNTLDLEYRLINRFIFLDKEDAEAEIQSYQKNWFENRESIRRYINTKINSGEVFCGYYNACIVVTSKDETEVEKKAQKIAQIINNSLEFATSIETDNIVNAWLGSLPGMPYHNKRKPSLTTVNLAHMMFV